MSLSRIKYTIYPVENVYFTQKLHKYLIFIVYFVPWRSHFFMDAAACAGSAKETAEQHRSRHHKWVHIADQHRRGQKQRQIVAHQKNCRQQERILSFVDHCGHIQTQKPPVKSGCEEKAQNGYVLIAVVRYDLLHHGPQSGQKALLWDLAAGGHRSGIGGQIAEAA